MAYVEYRDLSSPNEILASMVTYIKSRGFVVVKDLADDLNVYDAATTDGKKFCFQDRSGDYFIILRSANGTNIFGVNDETTMDTTTADKDPMYYGIGMVVAEGYSDARRWYNQYHAPLNNSNKDVQGVFLPAPSALEGTSIKYTLYCNEVTIPTTTLVFTIMKQDSKYKQVAHMAVGVVSKYESWEGGAIFSASASRYDMKTAGKCFLDTTDSDKYIRPLFSSGTVSNTFMRIDIDEAPSDSRGNILWASSGTNNETGKPMALPIRTSLATNGEIPHYYYLQSKDRTDSGMNVNTLNCISVNMPLFVAVRVDPDVLDNYAAAGTISGVFFISTYNTQTSVCYEMSYPGSGDLCQTFPMGHRRGATYGFDGISIKQETDTSGT